MTKRLLTKPKRLPDLPAHPRPRAMWIVRTERCETCEQRWEDVRFYGLPPSALCSKCPYRAKWIGTIFGSFE